MSPRHLTLFRKLIVLFLHFIQKTNRIALPFLRQVPQTKTAMAAVVLQSMSWPGAFVTASVIAFILILYFVLSRYFPRKMDLRNCHVLVTGGSSGIGLACAAECVRRGANVTLVARNAKNLGEIKVQAVCSAERESAQEFTCKLDSCKRKARPDTRLNYRMRLGRSSYARKSFVPFLSTTEFKFRPGL